MKPFIACVVVISILFAAKVAFASEPVPVFQRSLVTPLKDPVTLNVSLSHGNVKIGYSRDDQISIYAFGKDASGKYLPVDFFKNNLLIDQKGSQVWIRESVVSAKPSSSQYSLNYRIDVPYRTEVNSTVSGEGNQTLVGVYGPAKLLSGAGDIQAEYVRFSPVHASTGRGNISCIRDFQVNAETGEGNITLMEDGNSKAAVKSGHGRIEVGGARGTFDGSTDAGSLHIKAVLWDDWQLKSSSGSIRVELPRKSKFDLDLSTGAGDIVVERDDIPKPEGEVHQLHQQVSGGGKRIIARSARGSIFIE